jgi:CheY-like chemotaxis protein
VPDDKLNALAMPVYSLTIANILNGTVGNFSYSTHNEYIVRFTAPEAVVLVVDDVVTNLKVANGLLLPYKMRVDLCKSGVTAIEAMKINRYDIIFMDHKMPGMDGIETTLKIRSMGGEDPYYQEVPVIALTANAVLGTEKMFLENGFNDFLSKPIDTVKLNAVLEKWIPKTKQKTLV